MIDFLGLASHALEAMENADPGAFAALLSIAALTEVGVPFPFVIDTVLFYLGYRAAELWVEMAAAILMLLGGRVAGSSFAYGVAHLGGGYVLRYFGGRFPRLRRMVLWVSGRMGLRGALGVSMGRLSAGTSTGAVAAGTLRAPLVVALARLTPGLLTATSLASGILGLPYRYFVLGIGLASVGGDVALVGLGLTVERTLDRKSVV